MENYHRTYKRRTKLRNALLRVLESLPENFEEPDRRTAEMAADVFRKLGLFIAAFAAKHDLIVEGIDIPDSFKLEYIDHIKQQKHTRQQERYRKRR